MSRYAIYSDAPTLADFDRLKPSPLTGVWSQISIHFRSYRSKQRKKGQLCSLEDAYLHTRSTALSHLPVADDAPPPPPPIPAHPFPRPLSLQEQINELRQQLQQRTDGLQHQLEELRGDCNASSPPHLPADEQKQGGGGDDFSMAFSLLPSFPNLRAINVDGDGRSMLYSLLRASHEDYTASAADELRHDMKTTLLRMNDEEWQALVPSRFHDVGGAGVLSITDYVVKFLDPPAAHLPTSAVYLWQRSRHPRRSVYILSQYANNSEEDGVEWVKAESEEDAVVIHRIWQGGHRGVGHYYVRVLDGVTVFDRDHPLLAQLRGIVEERDVHEAGAGDGDGVHYRRASRDGSLRRVCIDENVARRKLRGMQEVEERGTTTHQ